MKCRACGREMLNRGAYFECSNLFCDYEEDIKNQGVSVNQEEEQPNIIIFKSTTMTRTIAIV
ncbi:MAG: hypothetical protein ABSB95_06555 [Dissulfurispiraceae bacterium]|jgi:hypothetical protein